MNALIPRDEGFALSMMSVIFDMEEKENVKEIERIGTSFATDFTGDKEKLADMYIVFNDRIEFWENESCPELAAAYKNARDHIPADVKAFMEKQYKENADKFMVIRPLITGRKNMRIEIA